MAKTRLEPLWIKFIADYSDADIPLPDASLDLILNRHGAYCEEELMCLLKPGVIFLTKQVGGHNDIRLNELIQDEVEFMVSCWTKDLISRQLKDAGVELLTVKEKFPPAESRDIGAVVFHLCDISWQIKDFNINKYHDKLYRIHQKILTNCPLQLHEHSILVEARNPLENIIQISGIQYHD
jgi:hypothetical protein